MNGVSALEEAIAAAAITGAPLHVVHVTSVGLRDTPHLLQMISEARQRGLDVSTECYPYPAGMTNIESAIFEDGWRERMGIDYRDLQWTATGERLTAESFAQYRKIGGRVAVFSIPENVVNTALAHALPMIASDGLLQNGKGHPRAAGTYARILGRYVREAKALTLMDALRKMTLMPAQRLEPRVPMMKNKGRIRIGADADLTIFDAARVIDRATFEEPGKYSEGIEHVLVNGVLVVENGLLRSGVSPGRAVRALIQ
jgi:dihydroorotase